MERPRLRPIEVLPYEQEGEQVLLLRDPSQLSQAVLTISPAALPILEALDGTHSLLDIQEAFVRATGELLFTGDLERILEHLDRALLLDSEHYRAERDRMEREFREAPWRPATHAGAAYPAGAAEYRALMDGHRAALDPPAAPAGPLAAVISPHIDYHRGGPTYARAWAGVSLEGVGRAVVLGTSHYGSALFAVTAKDYETPFGRLPADLDFLARLRRRYRGDLDGGEFLHRNEHSIELNAACLHEIAGESGIPLVPVLCGSFHPYVESGRSPAEAPEVAGLVEALRDTIAASPGRTLLVAAADLSHVGPQFGDPEAVDAAALASLESRDRGSLARAAAGDAEGFYRSIADEGDRRKVCGMPPIYLLLAALGGGRGVLGDYRQCATPELGSVVTIAAMRFPEPAA